MVAADSDRIPRVPPYSGGTHNTSALPVRGFHPLRHRFPASFPFLDVSPRMLLQPRHPRKDIGLGSSHFDRHYSGNRFFFLFLQVLRCFSSLRTPHLAVVTGLQPAGFPHSDMRGSIPVCGSPRLFAAYHVLLRSRKPRHPPFALLLFLFSESLYLYNVLVLPLKKQSRNCSYLQLDQKYRISV